MNSRNKRPPEYYMVLLWQYDPAKEAFHWHAIPKYSEEHAIELHDDIVQRTGALQVTIVHLPEHIVAIRKLDRTADWQALVNDRAQLASFRYQVRTELLHRRSSWQSAAEALDKVWPGIGRVPESMMRNTVAFGHIVAKDVEKFVIRRKY